MKPWLLQLHELTADQTPVVGGKAYNLGRLIRAGFKCPSGLVVSAIAYREFVQQHGLLPEIAAWLGECDVTNPQLLELTADHIGAMFIQREVSTAFADTVGSALSAYDEAPMAVRSSGSSEDLPFFSFAGQHETFLNVTGFPSVLLAIQRCWASLWSARAIQYRARAGIDHRTCVMAVILQPMIQSHVAGVAFTSDPSRSADDAVIINAASGLGEQVVAGSVSPDTLVVDRHTLLAKNLGGPGAEAPDPALDPDHVRAVAKVALGAERLFGRAQDVEWALYAGEIYVLQSRDITTAEQTKKARIGPLDRIFLEFFYDYFPRPMYAFDMAITGTLVDHTLGLAADFALRPAHHSDVLRENTDGSISVASALPRVSGRTIACFVPALLRALSTLRQNPDTWAAVHWPRLQQHFATLDAVDLTVLDGPELIRHCETLMSLRDSEVFLARRPYFWGGWLALAIFPLLVRCVAGADASRLQQILLSDLDHPTQRMNEQIAIIVERARAEAVRFTLVPRGKGCRMTFPLATEPPCPEIDRRLEKLILEFGGRSSELISLPSGKSWECDPEGILTLFNGLLAGAYRNPAGTPDRPVSIVSAQTRSGESVWRLRPADALLKKFLPKVRAMVRERDWVIHGYDCVSRYIRAVMFELGDRLLAKDVIVRREDIKFLSLSEVERVLCRPVATSEAKDLVMLRQFGRPRTTWEWQRPVKARRLAAHSDVVLSGLAASPGTHQGVARVVRSSEDFSRVSRGDILVCQATTPSWTPLFGIAGAVVADLGGALSHAAIVAREYGIPAVLNTSRATSALHDGDHYVVDGDKGIVCAVRKR